MLAGLLPRVGSSPRAPFPDSTVPLVPILAGYFQVLSKLFKEVKKHTDTKAGKGVIQKLSKSVA